MGRLAKKFDFLARLCAKIPDKDKPILVGGSAVEFYTRGISKSIDLDLVDEKLVLPDILRKLGFKRKGRHFYKDRIYVEIPSRVLKGRSIIVKYKNYKLRIICVEDLIIDRLNACVFWNSLIDCEQARMLLRAYKKKLDFVYLKERAIKEDVLTFLESIMKEENKNREVL